jgi:hypothetical protein
LKAGELLKLLEERSAGKKSGQAVLDRLEGIFSSSLSFDELEEELPPAIRYLGPGAWAETMNTLAHKAKEHT